ncbi:hypothetical protein GE061_000580 [Apolygus lucorum]|uniref:CCHC-type domain-containing protein n=1 Tax=Apolygus lucorum TaxID=248454 RepID=A0A8S9Y4Q5_APOLU|nr:hypothetical protein GE061_000580 [Apolygus lucorum]
MLGASLKGQALKLFTEMEPDMSYGDLIVALELRFGSRNQTTRNLSLLQTRTQEVNEDVRDSHQSIKNLARQAWPDARGGAAEDTAVFHFARGLRDARLCELVLGAGPKTMAQALQDAVRMEAVLQIARPERGRVRQGEITDEIPGLQAVTSRRRYSREDQRPEIICWRCDKSGHIAYSCPERRRMNSGNVRPSD